MEENSHDQRFYCKMCLLAGILCLGVLLTADTFKDLVVSYPVMNLKSGTKNDDDTSKESLKFSGCLGAPFLYVTVHDRTPNVLKYSRDGCLLSDNVLIMEKDAKNYDVEFRSMVIGNHKDHEALFIADASNSNSRLLVFGKCLEDDANYGRRQYIGTVAESSHNVGVDHTYGVCLDKDGNVYISNQHTDCVLRFQVDDFHPMVLPRALQLDQRLDYYEGTFIQFGLPREHGRDQQGIRSIAHVKSKIWIAHEDLSGIAVADIQSGLVTDIIPLEVPVGLHYDVSLDLVFVSCKSKDRGGIIYALDADTYEIYNAYHHHKMAHPAGMTTYGDTLFVAEQSIGAILTFDVKSAEFLKKIVHAGDPHVVMIEQLVLSSC